MLKSFLALFLTTQLISPVSDFEPNYSSKLNQSLPPTPTLDYSQSKPVASLATLPSYIVYNLDTGLVYSSSNSSKVVSPASFTKLLTAQVVVDLLPLDLPITVQSEWLGQEPTILGLTAGEQLSISDIMRGAIATSANDAATVLAYGSANLLGIKPETFISLMNQKANNLGMTHSHFVTPSGLDAEGQQTTLEDLSKLVYSTVKSYPAIVAVAKSDNQDIELGKYHQHYYLPNWNGLLGVYPNVTGLKIAYTETAGYSTIVTYQKDGLNLVAIVSGADSLIERDRAAANLLDAALIANHQKPVRLSPYAIRLHYAEWNKLAAKIRSESGIK